MTDTKHTPGPWSVFFGDQIGTKDCHIAQVHSEGRTMTAEQRAANARLLAAAPDMLAALRACELRLTHLAQDSVPVVAELKAVRAAIAKATA